ncbi:putative DNA topoisomerase I protein [Oceaniovalibus guishaninsula JLT2003]|uniref:DNA topoisomerase n=1 Tax=Oceaniovalibus guishaninsula JLT2003 TaxID=1231392 RepID=K2HC70_9RHOB|nr:DNA topoisomerase IB [Oceaniovalibus guishaninsula]EKE44202.1 putative DNA topoisomerase I protein [Oceaniovalibus guishaninsula JLT2003]
MAGPPDLIHYPDTRPGITRRRAGRGFSYIAPDGTRIDDAGERARLAALAVPPAYEDVWMCPLPRGHLQATGRDARARKQYRYHEDWTAFRARRKYDDLARFGTALPAIRRRIARDLNGAAGERDTAIAAILAMIDRLSLRIGNRDYTEENGSYGATTLRHRHLKLTDQGMKLDYKAKGGKRVRRDLRDKRLARVLHELDDLGGATLVSWVDADGAVHEVTSSAVNERLAEMAGQDGFTAKTFRTWNGTAAAMEVALREEAPTIAAMAEAAAERLGNTPAIARTSYIHPDVIALTERDLAERQKLAERGGDMRGLRVAERGVLGVLG